VFVANSDDVGSGALGKAIAARRITLGMKRKDVAEAADLSYPYIAEIENGGKTPSQRALNQIAQALGWSMSDLLRAAEQIPNTSEAVRALGANAPMYGMILSAPVATAGPEVWARREIGLPEDPPAEGTDGEMQLLWRRIGKLDEELRALRTEVARLKGLTE
jgi:transcriptional regulator with XRE-family HTH domain